MSVLSFTDLPSIGAAESLSHPYSAIRRGRGKIAGLFYHYPAILGSGGVDLGLKL
jgi:hypothetical protein